MKVLLRSEARWQFDELPTLQKARMLKLFERLRRWPSVSGAKPLRGELAGQYRMRTGDYRLQYVASDEGILIVKIGHRDGFYDE